MRVFVTGATGLIGFAVVKELVEAGHEVTGLARSTASAKKLTDAGARVLSGTIEDLDCLRRGASAADGAIHTAFYHQLSHMPLSTRLRVLMGGAPSGIFRRFMGAGVAADRKAVLAIGQSLGTGSPFVATFGTMGMEYGHLATEDEPYNHDPSAFGFPRAKTEDILKDFASRGLRTSAIRLAPVVHGPSAFGLISLIIPTARKKKQSAYVGDGRNRWPAVHYLDAARLFRLALEKGLAGGTYHGVAEEGIPLRQVAEVIGRRLNVPVISKQPAQVAKHFGLAAPFVTIDNPASSRLTQERLGWEPKHQKLLSHLEESDAFNK